MTLRAAVRAHNEKQVSYNTYKIFIITIAHGCFTCIKLRHLVRVRNRRAPHSSRNKHLERFLATVKVKEREKYLSFTQVTNKRSERHYGRLT